MSALPDAVEQDFATALTGERACWWSAGDVAAHALAQVKTKAERRRVVNALASVGHCTSSYVATIARCATAFEQGLRQPNLSPPLYLACVRTAKRLNEAPATILQRALDGELHAREVAAMGRRTAPGLGFDGTCTDGCGVRVRVTAEPGTIAKNTPVVCPVCGGREGATPILGRMS